jgi:hypothetical protein
VKADGRVCGVEGCRTERESMGLTPWKWDQVARRAVRSAKRSHRDEELDH